MFVHLHTHSYYSLLAGTVSPQALVDRARQLKQPALALTDTNNLYGAIPFFRRAKEVGVQPIIGAELVVQDAGNVVALVANEKGYHNLCELITRGHLKGGHGNFVLQAVDVFRRQEGLFFMTGGAGSHLYEFLRRREVEAAYELLRHWAAALSGRLYVELQLVNDRDVLVNRRLADFAQTLQVPLVADNDAYFIDSADWNLHRILCAIDDNTNLNHVKTRVEPANYLKSSAEMEELFKAVPEALENTLRIVQRCRFEFQLGKPVFPRMTENAKKSSFRVLAEEVKKGLEVRYGPAVTESVKQRARKELRVIRQMGFPDYFLIVKDVVDFCHRENIPCVGRGSAGDSLVAYVLGITQVDPIRYGLYFERFLNPQRSSPPDIDLDICWKNRDRVLDYVYRRFGKEKTAMICTFNTFQLRSSVRDVAKVYGIPEEEITVLTSHLPHYSRGNLRTILEGLPEYQHMRHQFHLYEKILDVCERLSDMPRHLSIHAGGVIIAPDRLTHFLPLEEAGKGLVISQMDMYAVEQLGLVKMDFLGVRSLSIMSDTIRAVRDIYETGSLRVNEGVTVEEPAADAYTLPGLFEDNKQSAPSAPEFETHMFALDPARGHVVRHKREEYFKRFNFPFLKIPRGETRSILDLKSIPANDARVISLLRTGHSMGCFQLESPGMRGLLQKMEMESMDDVVVSVALIRPGAANSGMKDVYIRRRAGLENTSYLHPALEPVLKDTYGVIIYQEQVMQVAHQVAGISLAEADTLRRAMTKHRDKKEMMKLKSRFIRGVSERGMSPFNAARLWKYLLNFTGYGFNKAHSATYGMIAYQSAFLKTYFPVPFMTAVLNNQGGFYSTMAYVEEARRMGIRILPPDVNDSQVHFSFRGDSIRTALRCVYELSHATMKRIIARRQNGPYTDLFTFLRTVRPAVNEAVNLAKCGALRSVEPSEPRALTQIKLYYQNKGKSQTSRILTDDLTLQPYNTAQRIMYELEILGFSATAHPLFLFRDFIPADTVPSHTLPQYRNRVVTICGWMVTSRRVVTEKGEQMKFITLEDHFGLMEVVFFPDLYRRHAVILHGHGPFVVRARVQSRVPGEMNLIAEDVTRIEPQKSELEAVLRRGVGKAG